LLWDVLSKAAFFQVRSPLTASFVKFFNVDKHLRRQNNTQI
jgi:hypothetical protein